MLRVVALSDLHGRLPKIPRCDVVLIAGDISPDFHRRCAYDPDLMRAEQMQWLRNEFRDWEQSIDSDTLLFATPGNHDWINQFPEECRTKLFIDEGIEVQGRSFYFTPWVRYCGPWNYQIEEEKERMVRFAEIPVNLDVLVTHSPPYNCMDQAYGAPGELCGCRALRNAIHVKQPKHVVFGHIHEGQRFGNTKDLGKSICHNVSMWGVDWKPTQFEV